MKTKGEEARAMATEQGLNTERQFWRLFGKRQQRLQGDTYVLTSSAER